MSTAMVKQTHIEVRRYCGRAHIATRMRSTEPHKRATRRELIRSAAITTMVLLIAAACALFLTTNPLHR